MNVQNENHGGEPGPDEVEDQVQGDNSDADEDDGDGEDGDGDGEDGDGDDD